MTRDSMLAYLEGELLQLGPDFVICKVGGVGYHITIGTRCAEAMKNQLGHRLSFWIEEIVRDGQVHLFGCLTEEEMTWFRWLICVQGVGGKMALSLLSTFSIPQLHALICQGRDPLLRSAEGVGPKLAVRIVHELRDKAHKWTAYNSCDHLSTSLEHEEAIRALCALGYRLQEATEALSPVTEKGLSTPDLVRLGLQRMGSKG